MRQWQAECEYFGKHTQLVPAEFARGYQHSYNDPERVSRAIPVEGYVSDQTPFTEKAPQAWYWTKKEPDSCAIGIRFKRAVRLTTACILSNIRRIVK